jgi:hypothetical protein
MVVTLKIANFLDVRPCSLVEGFDVLKDRFPSLSGQQ